MNNNHDGLILRFEQIPKTTPKKNYLIVCDNIENLVSHNLLRSRMDIFSLKQSDFLKPTVLIKKLRKINRKNIGIEIKISDLRKSTSQDVGKWIRFIDEIYKFCKLSDCQIIFSSGASSQYETISSNTFNSILKICNIKSNHYWKDLEQWLDLKTKVYEYDI
ncbi:MAG: hypothetical protein ACPKPY_04225 [Nitrososphaeraceae archaeon]